MDFNTLEWTPKLSAQWYREAARRNAVVQAAAKHTTSTQPLAAHGADRFWQKAGNPLASLPVGFQ